MSIFFLNAFWILAEELLWRTTYYNFDFSSFNKGEEKLHRNNQHIFSLKTHPSLVSRWWYFRLSLFWCFFFSFIVFFLTVKKDLFLCGVIIKFSCLNKPEKNNIGLSYITKIFTYWFRITTSRNNLSQTWNLSRIYLESEDIKVISKVNFFLDMYWRSQNH